MSTKTTPSSGSGAGSGKPPGAAKWCSYHRVNTHDTIECRAAKQAGVVKQSQQEVKAAKAKKRNEWIGGLIHAEVARRASQLAANSPGQAAPSAANNNFDPQDAAKDSNTDPNAAKDSESGG